jgi:hypothetical protein
MALQRARLIPRPARAAAWTPRSPMLKSRVVMEIADYRVILSAEFEKRKDRNPAYSWRASARDLGIQSSRLSEVMAGRYGLSLAGASQTGYPSLASDFLAKNSPSCRVWAEKDRIFACRQSRDPSCKPGPARLDWACLGESATACEALAGRALSKANCGAKHLECRPIEGSASYFDCEAISETCRLSVVDKGLGRKCPSGMEEKNGVVGLTLKALAGVPKVLLRSIKDRRIDVTDSVFYNSICVWKPSSAPTRAGSPKASPARGAP